MDLVTLLAARREAHAPAVIADLAAAERDLLARVEPTSAFIEPAAAVVAEHQRAGRDERAWPLLRRLEALLPGLDDACAARVSAALGAQALLEVDAEAFVDRSRRAAEAFDRAGDARAACVERAALGAALVALGDDAQGGRELDEAIPAAQRAALHVAAGVARLARARLCLRRGEAEAAEALAAGARADFEASGDRRMEGVALAMAAGARGGDVDMARRALDLCGDAPERAIAVATLARGLFASGATADAVRAVDELRAGDVGWLLGGPAPAWIAGADVRAGAGDAAGAAGLLVEAKRAILAFAFKLRSQAVRRSFLERIPEHRRALETR